MPEKCCSGERSDGSLFCAMYKSGTVTMGRGHRNACVGLGTWGHETRDLRTSSIGRGDVWDGNRGTSNTGTQGMRNDDDDE